MAAELGVGYVRLLPSMRGFGAQVGKQTKRQLPGAGRQAGAAFGGGIAAGAMRSIGGVARQIAPILGGIGLLRLGRDAWQSATGIQQTEAALTGLYGSGREATSVMTQLRQVAKDSPIDHAAFLTGAENLAYMGVEGDRAVGVLGQIETALVASGKGSEAMNQVTDAMVATVNQGRATAQEINRISQAGFPMWEMLAEHAGVSMGEIRDQVSSGAVEIEDLLAAMESGAGGTFAKMEASAEEAAGTFQNQWARAKDNVIVGLGELLRPLADNLAPLIGTIGDKAQKYLGRIPDILARANQAASDAGVWTILRDAIGAIGSVLRGLQPVLPVIGAALVGAFGAALGVLRLVTPLIQQFGQFLQNNTGLVQVFAAAVIGGFTAMKIISTVTAIVHGFRGAFAALNMVMRANPIGLVITAIAALAAGLVWAYQNSETFRNIVDAAFKTVGSGAKWLWNKAIKPAFDFIVGAIGFVIDTARVFMNTWSNVVGSVSGFLRRLWNVASSIFSSLVASVRNGISAIGSAFNRVSGFVSQVIGFFRNLLSGIRGTIGNAVHTVSDLPRRFYNALLGFATRMWYIGRDAIQGLINGVKAMAGRAVSAARGVVDSAISGAKRLLGIRSPSRVFAQIGQDTGAGFVNGLRDMRRDVARASTSLADAAVIDAPSAPGMHRDMSFAARHSSRSAAPAETRIVFEGNSGARDFMSWLTKNIRVEGGSGNVQRYLGNSRR